MKARTKKTATVVSDYAAWLTFAHSADSALFNDLWLSAGQSRGKPQDDRSTEEGEQELSPSLEEWLSYAWKHRSIKGMVYFWKSGWVFRSTGGLWDYSLLNHTTHFPRYRWPRYLTRRMSRFRHYTQEFDLFHCLITGPKSGLILHDGNRISNLQAPLPEFDNSIRALQPATAVINFRNRIKQSKLKEVHPKWPSLSTRRFTPDILPIILF